MASTSRLLEPCWSSIACIWHSYIRCFSLSAEKGNGEGLWQAPPGYSSHAGVAYLAYGTVILGTSECRERSMGKDCGKHLQATQDMLVQCSLHKAQIYEVLECEEKR